MKRMADHAECCRQTLRMYNRAMNSLPMGGMTAGDTARAIEVCRNTIYLRERKCTDMYFFDEVVVALAGAPQCHCNMVTDILE